MFHTLKEVELIGKYMKWQEWQCFEFFKWNRNQSLYETWQDHLKDTCYNSPCWECWKKFVQRTSKQGRMSKGNQRMPIIPKGFTLTKSGLKIYDQ
jgi:hypothetical protein